MRLLLCNYCNATSGRLQLLCNFYHATTTIRLILCSYYHATATTAKIRGNNILDLVMSTKERLIGNFLVGNRVGDADHNMVEFTIKVPRPDPLGAVRIPKFAHTDFRKLIDHLSAANLIDQLLEGAVDCCCRILNRRNELNAQQLRDNTDERTASPGV